MLLRQGIFHRDLRLENLLLAGNYFEAKLKISNFGYSKANTGSMLHTKGFGAPVYTPPELLTLTAGLDEGPGGYSGNPVDVWACGVILYCMLTAQLPFVVSAPLSALHSLGPGLFPTIPKHLSPCYSGMFTRPHAAQMHGSSSWKCSHGG